MRPTLVFDLDGTLVDTATDLVATLNVILEREGLRSVPFLEARSMVGHGARVMIERGLAANGTHREAADLDRLFDDYIAYYSAHLADGSQPFPGVVEALDHFSAEGWSLAVCTNKLEYLSVDLLEKLGLAARFDAICGADTFAARKPDPLALIETIRRTGGQPEAAIMVGDSKTDIDTAKAAAVPVIAVDFGYTPVHVRDLGPDIVISHFDELAGAVAKVRASR
ncbi:phosphoglycolate phosphatase [Kaistia algarum]|uniref:phosphoglycolate phosphatase n=1 Tax=Kaistia algarum TaxID=2083279 RepID=UPI000CE905FD|nr:phosphoglycolate phosphatase [Kaistia algarum]MCX5514551.1 phosphoglycolate phosphatase [Kaistia algarum]PPE77581.1 phosphoglycolate phosphatase [Kaistia algarum]